MRMTINTYCKILMLFFLAVMMMDLSAMKASASDSTMVFTAIKGILANLSNRQVKRQALSPVAPPVHTTKAGSLWAIFIAGFLGGLAALLMPCIFPMLPLTVGYFTKRHKTGKRASAMPCFMVRRLS